MTVMIKLLVIFLSTFLLFYIVSKNIINQRRMNRRIHEILPSNSNLNKSDSPELKENVFKRFIKTSAKVFTNVTFVQKSEKKLQTAGINLKPEEFFVLSLIVAGGAGFFSFLLYKNLFLIIISVLVGFIIPSKYMERKMKKRLNLLPHQLIETLGMMANSMRAGFSFMQAIKLAGDEMPDPIGPEFKRVIREVGLGVPFDKAFQDLVKRLPNKELEVVVQAILVQRTSGGNLAELMETMEDTIRGRIRVFEELKTLTAQGKMSSWIITLLPVVLATYMYFVRPDYFSLMLEHPLGWLMVSFAIISGVIGWALIQKIIKIEV